MTKYRREDDEIPFDLKGWIKAVLKRGLVLLGGDQARVVSHVGHEEGTDLVRSGAHAFVVPVTGVGRGTRNNELGLVLHCKAINFIVVDEPLLIKTILNRLEVDGSSGDLLVRGLVAVGQAEKSERLGGSGAYCPPEARARPRTTSLGSRTAVRAAKLATEPE